MIREIAIELAKEYGIDTAQRYLDLVLNPARYGAKSYGVGRNSGKIFKNSDLEVISKY